jgi:ribosomal protein S18 acetylase RimI-like enzyme
MQKNVHIRNLEKTDLGAIVNIEERVTGVARRDYWAKRIEMSEAIRPHWASLIAEINSQVVGFILGRAGEMEFGLPSTVAWIEIIGVDPAFRSQGIARALVQNFLESAEDHDVRTIFTLVDSENREMAGFFSRVGFGQGKMIHFHKDLGS